MEITKKEFNIKFIREIKMRPVIWDAYCVENKIYTKKKAAWREISLLLNTNGNYI